MSEVTIESFGITKSPLDAYRYRGNRIGNNAPLTTTHNWNYIIGDNNAPTPLVMGVDYEQIPTITKKLELSDTGFNVSPCPCKSEECMEYFRMEKIKFETLQNQKK
jgi:hypothetical protein